MSNYCSLSQPLINPSTNAQKAPFTLFQGSLQDENADCWRRYQEKKPPRPLYQSVLPLTQAAAQTASFDYALHRSPLMAPVFVTALPHTVQVPRRAPRSLTLG